MALCNIQSYKIGSNHVTIYGQQEHFRENSETSRLQAIDLGAKQELIAQLIVAGGVNDLGHKQIVQNTYDKISYADGVLISEPGAAGIIQTADCPALILYDVDSGDIVLVHAGRPALSPSQNHDSKTVVANAMAKLTERGATPNQILALVVGNICGSCFKHDHESAKYLLIPFANLPDQVFADRSLGALSLYEVIKHELMTLQVPERNIWHEGPCTLETPGLSSHRRGDLTRNTIIVVRP